MKNLNNIIHKNINAKENSLRIINLRLDFIKARYINILIIEKAKVQFNEVLLS